MNDKHKRFADEYLVDLNGTQAAIRAGYSPKTANVQASQLLTNLNIQTYIKEKSQTIADKLGIDAQYVLGSFKKVADRSMQAEPVLNNDGEETGEYIFNANGANKALEMLGKHLKLWDDSDKNKQATVINIQLTKY